jgi:putative hydrolase of the HAD superfamily
MTPPAISAVIFDLGGVVLDSPLHEIARFEADHGLETGLINRVVHRSGPEGAWARHERGTIPRALFLELLADELAAGGATVDTTELMGRIDTTIRPRPVMIEAIRRLRRKGLAVAAITNNWEPFPAGGLRNEFDVFLESVVEGVRKPEPEIYRRCLQRLSVEASDTVMLDDLGPNLKPARELGMITVKVADVTRALAELESLTGVKLAV